jgi:hypothetical protein
MKDQLTHTSHQNAPTARNFERFSTLDKVGRYISLARFFLALAAAPVFWDFSNIGALLIFACLFAVPIPSAFDFCLPSGRLVRKVTARSFFTIPNFRRMLEVRYEACSDDFHSMEFLREEVEVCTAVMEECESLDIDTTEIVSTMPTRVNDFNMEQSSSKIFEKVNGRWVDASFTT